MQISRIFERQVRGKKFLFEDEYFGISERLEMLLDTCHGKYVRRTSWFKVYSDTPNAEKYIFSSLCLARWRILAGGISYSFAVSSSTIGIDIYFILVSIYGDFF